MSQRTNVLHEILTLVLFIVFVASPALAERGRVSVKDGTVTSDKGTLLRGATMELESAGSSTTRNALEPENWKAMRDLKLNIIRVDIKLSNANPNRVTVAEQLPNIDKVVELAARNGLYVMLMTSVAPGSYNKEELFAFWSKVAPRYKNRTHVLYEMVNEPVGWSALEYKDSAIRDLKSIYDVMRRAAPETHIVL